MKKSLFLTKAFILSQCLAPITLYAGIDTFDYFSLNYGERLAQSRVACSELLAEESSYVPPFTQDNNPIEEPFSGFAARSRPSQNDPYEPALSSPSPKAVSIPRSAHRLTKRLLIINKGRNLLFAQRFTHALFSQKNHDALFELFEKYSSTHQLQELKTLEKQTGFVLNPRINLDKVLSHDSEYSILTHIVEPLLIEAFRYPELIERIRTEQSTRVLFTTAEAQRLIRGPHESLHLSTAQLQTVSVWIADAIWPLILESNIQDLAD